MKAHVDSAYQTSTSHVTRRLIFVPETRFGQIYVESAFIGNTLHDCN